VDTKPPALAVSSGPSNGATINGSNVSFAFTGDAGVPITCVTDDAAPVDCTNGLQLTGLAPGLHSVTASSTDAADNTATLSRLFFLQAAAGTNTKNVRVCVRTKVLKRGRIVRTRAGKVKTRLICKSVSITY
jgi:hypothetical protein